jgi:hypothetical protein
MKVCEWLGPGYTSINSGKNAFNPYNSVTKYSDWHKLVTDLFYDFVSTLLVWIGKFKMPSNWKISVI